MVSYSARAKSDLLPVLIKLFFLYLKKKIIYLFSLRWVFVAARRLFSSCSEQGLLFSLRWLLLLWSTGSRCAGFSSCGTRAQ